MIRRGVRRTLALLERRYYWPNMKGDYYVSTFFTCLQDKTERSHPAGLLEPLPIPERPWESLSLDFIVGLPKVGDSFHSCVQVKLSFWAFSSEKWDLTFLKSLSQRSVPGKEVSPYEIKDSQALSDWSLFKQPFKCTNKIAEYEATRGDPRKDLKKKVKGIDIDKVEVDVEAERLELLIEWNIRRYRKKTVSYSVCNP